MARAEARKRLNPFRSVRRFRGDGPGKSRRGPTVILPHAVSQKPDTFLPAAADDGQLATAAQFAANVVVVSDAGGTITWVNEAFTRLSGYGAEEAVGRRPADLLHGPETDAAVAAAMRQALRRGEGFKGEVLNYRKDRTTYWVAIDCRPVRDAAGTLQKFVAVELDITARRRTEQELARTHRRLAELIATTPGIVWEADPATWRFTFVSGAAEAILGYPAEAWCREPDFWATHLLPEDRAKTVEARGAAGARDGNCEFEYRMIAADGRTVWIQDIVNVVREADGRRWARGVMVDITRRHETERTLARLNDRVRLAVEGRGDGVWEFDFATQRLTWDARMHAIYGRQTGDFLETVPDWQRSILAEDLPAVQASFERVLTSDNPVFGVEFRIRRGDEIRTIAGSGILERHPDGRPDRAVGLNRDVTEERRREAAQRTAAESLALALRASRLGYWRRNLITGATEWDARMFEIYGVTEIPTSEFFNRTLLHPDEVAKLAELSARVRAGARDFQLGFRIVRPDGEIRHIESQGFATPDECGRPEWVTGVNIDVTRYVEAERSAGRDRNYLLSVFETVAEGILVFSSDGRVRVNNRAAEQILGLERGSLVGRSLFDPRWHVWREDGSDFSPSDYPAAVTLRTGQPLLGVRMGMERGDGARVWLSVNSTPLANADGGREVVLSIADMTERVAAEAEVQRTTARLRLALETARLVSWEWNLARGSFRVMACGAPCILGFAPAALAEATDATWLEKTHPDDRARAEETLQAVIKGRTGEWHCDHRLLAADGQWRWVRQVGRVTERWPDGQPKFMMGTTQEISGEKAAEEERLHLLRQLLQSQKLETLGTLAGGIAHDFGNILTGIAGHLSMVAHTLEPGHPALDSVESARRGGDRARELVKRLMQYSRRESQVAPAVIDLREVVKDTASLVTAAVGSNIAMRLALPDKAVPVVGDFGQLQQVLTNLCVNAAHAIGRGPGKVVVTLGRDEAGGRRAVLAVEDNGCGMDAGTAARVFEPFFTTKSRSEGTGLGLSIVQGIVKEHGGAVAVKSVPRVGSTFEVRLPLAPAAPAGTAVPAVAATGPRVGRAVLVVDDEKVVGEVIRLVLRGARQEADYFQRPAGALAAFVAQPHRYGVAVLDLSMPEISGPELLARLRELRPGLPVVLATGDAGRFNLTAFAADPTVALIEKPFEADQLLAAVGRVLAAAERATA